MHLSLRFQFAVIIICVHILFSTCSIEEVNDKGKTLIFLVGIRTVVRSCCSVVGLFVICSTQIKIILNKINIDRDIFLNFKDSTSTQVKI